MSVSSKINLKEELRLKDDTCIKNRGAWESEKNPVNCGVFVGSAVFTPRRRVTDNLATRTMHV